MNHSAAPATERTMLHLSVGATPGVRRRQTPLNRKSVRILNPQTKRYRRRIYCSRESDVQRDGKHDCAAQRERDNDELCNRGLSKMIPPNVIRLQSTDSLRREDRRDGDGDDERNGEAPVGCAVRKGVEAGKENQAGSTENPEEGRDGVHVEVPESSRQYSWNSSKMAKIAFDEEGEGEEQGRNRAPCDEQGLMRGSHVCIRAEFVSMKS